jgi:hypothetical protein
VKTTILRAICLLLICLTAFFIYDYIQAEYEEETISVGFQGAAARNKLLAAGRLIERYGASEHYIPAYSKPPQSSGTLVFAAPREYLSSEQNRALLDWAETEGAHLVISPILGETSNPCCIDENEDDEDEDDDSLKMLLAGRDPLLASLGISAKRLPDSNVTERQPQAGSPASETSDIRLPDGTYLKARFDSRIQLEDLEGGSGWQITNPSGYKRSNFGISKKWGKGRVTVLANLDFINNDLIGEGDHAALFTYVVSLAEGQDIWLVYRNTALPPAPWLWLLDNAWATLIAAALLLAAWLWMASRHFGPLLPARATARRSIVEHISASARYLWRCKLEQTLYQTLCDDFHKRARLCHPQWDRLPEQELNQQIALFAHEAQIPQISGLTERNVKYLLDASRPRSKKQFAADSHLLDILRNKL